MIAGCERWEEFDTKVTLYQRLSKVSPEDGLFPLSGRKASGSSQLPLTDPRVTMFKWNDV
jgi:hypothetical protein